MTAWLLRLLRVAIVGALLGGAGCAVHRQAVPADDTATGNVRAARPLGEEDSVADRAGQVMVVLLVIVVTVGLILVPVVFLL